MTGGFDTAGSLIRMGKIAITEEQRERFKGIDVLAFLDALCAKHGLKDHMEARRFIREHLDRHRRSQINPHASRFGVRGKNLVYQVISPSGEVLPPEDRPERGYTAPEQPISPPEDPFDPISLSMRSREKSKRSKNRISMGISGSSTRKSPKKPEKVKSERKKMTDEERKAKKREYARARYVKKDRPAHRQDAPKPGTQTEVIINTLISNGWDTGKTVNQLLDHEIFAHFKDRGPARHKQNVSASVSVSKGKWQARLQDV